jgi:glutamine synthetase
VGVASKYGLHATFAPRVFMTSVGSSAHAHISIHPTTRHVFPDTHPESHGNLASYEAHFLAAVLKHIPALQALTLPIPASFKRVTDNLWSGGTYLCWGTENREAPIRLTNATSPISRNFELRFLDGTCNPFLALAGILGVGLRGIMAKEALTVKDCPGPLTAAEMSEAERDERGVTGRMSLSWEEGRRRFEEDAVVRESFGGNFVEKYLSVNKVGFSYRWGQWMMIDGIFFVAFGRPAWTG